MRRTTPRLRATVAALFLALTAALPAAPAAAVDPPVPEGLVLRPQGATESSGPAPAAAAPQAGAVVPAGFRDELVVGGLDEPTVVQFDANGRMFVAEKRGRVLLFDSMTDTTPTVFANLETQVHNLWDRGFLAMALDPAFTTGRPYVYVAYTANDIIGDGQGAPRWPSDPDAPWNDRCPSPPGATTDGCVVSSRVSRLTANGNVAGPEQELVHAWCQQFPGHSIGSLAFGSEGALYVTGGEGADFFREDWGQLGGTLPGTPTPVNPCGDPTSQGGALRAQDLRTSGDPVALNGTLIRINPDTGAAWPTNNLIGSSDANARRIVAYGLRNPFRFAIRPGSTEVWIGDVGNFTWEEINEVPNPNAAPRNFGWPCYEGAPTGPARNPDWDDLDIAMCENLYSSAGAVTGPTFAYGREGAPEFAPGDGCGTDSSSIAGLTFLGTTSGYPDAYDGALFVTDYNRRCIWWIPADGAGRPNFSGRQLFADLVRSGETSGGAVHLTTAPNGDIVYADFDRQEIRRLHWYSNLPPTASFTANPSSGPLPLQVAFDASASVNPTPADPLQYDWDLDGDGSYDDGTGKTISRTYTSRAQITVGLRVTSSFPLQDTENLTIWPGYAAPAVTIDTPTEGFRFAVGETISFSGTARDGGGTTLPPSSMAWSVNIEHCPSDCHSHPPFFTSSGASGSFPAPDHGQPSHLRLKLTVTDGPLVTTVIRDLHPIASASTVFRPVGPVRLLDSRVRNGLTGVFKHRTARTFQVTGRGGIPADAVAVTGNLTVVGQTGAGYITLTPTPTNSPTSSNLNFPVGVNRATLASPTLGPGGKVSVVYVSKPGRTAHIVFDVTGYFTRTGSNGTYHPLDPVRLLDSRTGNGLSGRFVVGQGRSWTVAGRGGIPANATAVTANLTVLSPSAAGHLTLYPAGAPRTTASTLHFRAAENAANGVVMRLGASGRLSALLSGPARARAHLVLDVTGYFVDDASGARYVPLTGRLLNTRAGTGLAGRFQANQGRTLLVAGRLDVPSDAVAINGTLTSTASTAAGYLLLLPVAVNSSQTSSLSFRAGEVRANGVFGRLSGGSVGILYASRNGASTDVVFDLAGYFR